MSDVQTRLKCILEGTLMESVELDLKHEKWCTCRDPSGFRFVTSEGHEQIWRHLACGGLVIRPMRPDKP